MKRRVANPDGISVLSTLRGDEGDPITTSNFDAPTERGTRHILHDAMSFFKGHDRENIEFAKRDCLSSECHCYWSGCSIVDWCDGDKLVSCLVCLIQLLKGVDSLGLRLRICISEGFLPDLAGRFGVAVNVLAMQTPEFP
jgi:hypothetical protein